VAGLALPEAAESAVGKAAELAPKVAGVVDAAGDAAQASANKIINETVGSYKGDFKRGANPGRGYNTSVDGPSLTMRSLSNKVDQVQNEVGSNIQRVISDSTNAKTLIPVETVQKALGQPIKDAYDGEMAPGGMGNVEPFNKYAANFKQTLQEGAENGGFTPQQVFDLKKQIAQKAKFNNTTPEGILEVRQQQVGALGGVLTDAIPDLKGLNQEYQDLVPLRLRAQWRAESGSLPLNRAVRKGLVGGALELGEVPAMTGAATVLNRTGGALKSVAEKLGNAASDGADSVGGPVGGQAALPSGSAKWAASGADKLRQHITANPGGITAADIASLPKRVLVSASDLTPGSKAMMALVAQIAAQKSKEDDTK
jgi:hypothetical protein